MPQIHKRFRIKEGIDIKRVPDLPHIVTLMMFLDAIYSSLRSYRSLDNQVELTSGVDRLFSVVIGAGWASEAIRVLKDLKGRNSITNDDILRLPDASPVNPKDVWMKCLSPDVAFARLHGVRDNVFAHFWNRKSKSEPDAVAKEIVMAVGKGEYEPVFAEWIEIDGKKSNLKSIMTMAYFGIAQRVFGKDLTSQTVIARELGDTILSIGILLDHLIAVWCDRVGLVFEPYQDSCLNGIA